MLLDFFGGVHPQLLKLFLTLIKKKNQEGAKSMRRTVGGTHTNGHGGRGGGATLF